MLIVTLSAPTWLAWPFLCEPRRNAVLSFLSNLTDWIKAIAGPAEPKPIAVYTPRPEAVPAPQIPDATGRHRMPQADLTDR